jgi:hypothetical protein
MSFLSELMRRIQGRATDRRRALRYVVEKSTAESRLAAQEQQAGLRRFTADDGLLVGTSTSEPGLPVRLPWGQENVHTVIQGATGSGKTSYQTSLFSQRLPRGFCGCFDAKEGFYQGALRVIAAHGLTLAPEQADALRKSLIVIDPFSENLVPLNICAQLPGYSPEFQAYEFALALRRLLQGELTSHAENLLRHLVILLMESGLTLVEAPTVLRDDVVRGVLAIRSKNDGLKEFFLHDYQALPQVSKDSLVNRLQALLLPENVRLMLGADNLVDLRSAFEEGAPVLAFIGKGLSVPEEQANILGSLILQLAFQGTYARSADRRQPYLLFIDEFTNLINGPALAERFSTALTAARSFGLQLVLAHHSFVQVPTVLRHTILANADIVSVFRTSAESAAAFGEFLPHNESSETKSELQREKLEAVQRLPNREFFWFDRRSMKHSFRLRTPDLIPPHRQVGMREKQFEQVISEQGWLRGGATVSKEDLKNQISKRRERLRQMINPQVNVGRDATDVSKVDEKKARPRRPRLG